MAMVHHERQDKDFDLIKSGDPIFLTLEGEVVLYEGETLCMIFINEAAYYEKDFALCLARKISFELKE